MKSYFGGHDNVAHNNLYAFTQGHCVNVGYGHESFKPGHEDGFFNNTCIMKTTGPYMKVSCAPSLLRMGDNKVYDPGNATGLCGTTLAAWQAAGHDNFTTIAPTPDAADILRWAESTLGGV